VNFYAHFVVYYYSNAFSVNDKSDSELRVYSAVFHYVLCSSDVRVKLTYASIVHFYSNTLSADGQ